LIPPKRCTEFIEVGKIIALSDTSIRKAKPADKDYKLRDEGNLYLLVKASGGKYWRFDYRYLDKRKTLALGTYPDISLEAREAHQAARKLLANGIDPSAYKQSVKQPKQQQAANSFELIAREWHTKQSATWGKKHASIVLRRLEQDIFPWLGSQPIASITPPQLLKALRQIEQRGANETAHRIMQVCGQVFRYAVATGKAETDPTRDLRGALSPVKASHLSAITEPAKIPVLPRAIQTHQGTFITRCAIQLLPHVFTRPGELRNMEWQEIDLDAALWSIPANKMKMQSDHLVPLSQQALAILKEIQPLTQHCSNFVFHSLRTTQRPISGNTLTAALRRMDFASEEMTAHGFRAMARTNLDEILGFRIEVIEMQLAHTVRDANGRAYNRTQYLEERRRMMQSWADWLDGLRDGTAQKDNVVQFRQA